MTARPWGTTGRVTLDGPCWGYGVKVDRAVVGVVIATDSGTGPWRASIHFDVDITGAKEAHLPSLDAAVMWVLRRADADVWRQERGPVVRIRRNSRRLWWGYRNDGLVVASGSTWPRAMAAVRTYLSEATP